MLAYCCDICKGCFDGKPEGVFYDNSDKNKKEVVTVVC